MVDNLTVADVPALPTEISPNGREIWDWAHRFSEHVHRLDKMRELRADIAKVRCGDCNHWMKSRECPREHNVNGYSRGPSNDGFICGQFLESSQSAELREKRRNELQELEARQS